MGRNCKDYSGQICGIWEVIERDWNPQSKSHETFWISKCKTCGNIASVRKTDLDKNPRACNNCKGEVISQILSDKGMAIHPVKIGENYGHLTVIQKPYTKNNKMYCLCQCECGNKIEVRKDHLLGLNHSRTISCGCKSMSSGELKIKQLLEKYNINFKMQYCINNFSKYSLFDFAIFDKDNNLIKLIEFDGEQHFKPVDFFGGEEKYLLQLERDARKNKYCQENNLELLRIPYWDYDKIDLSYLGIEN